MVRTQYNTVNQRMKTYPGQLQHVDRQLRLQNIQLLCPVQHNVITIILSMGGQRRAIEQIVDQFSQIQRQIGELVRCFGFLRSQMNVYIVLCIQSRTTIL